jgi:hypothetical protein
VILILLASAVLFLVSVLLLAAAWTLGSIAIGTLSDARRVRPSVQPHHEGEDWPTGMDTWQ